MKTYCVYLHHHDGQVFYVGCGTPERALQARDRSRLWREYVKTHGPYEVNIVYWHTERTMCLAEEVRRIKALQPSCNVHFNTAMHTERRQQERHMRESWLRQEGIDPRWYRGALKVP